MTSSFHRIAALGACLLGATVAVCLRTETKAAASWDRQAAASYLDRRATWWIEWPRAARDHDTVCVSCHTAVPYAIARPALRAALGEKSPSPSERKLLDSVTKRVRLWKDVAPFYSDADRGAYKTVESRGTESVLNALILASNDAPTRRLSEDTLAALENMWSEQLTDGNKKGSWSWLRFANEPWEADDSGFYGAALAAISVGLAPQNYRAQPEIQNNLKMLREFLNRESASQTPINRVVLLWASAELPGLLTQGQEKAIIQEVLGKQKPDGGWSLSSLSGDWKRNDGTPQETVEDGYATGLITFALLQAGVPRDNPQQQKALAWLTENQGKSEGSWMAFSLNKNKEHHISPGTALFMNDAATAYAVLALTEASRR